jgi:hypothetical protein
MKYGQRAKWIWQDLKSRKLLWLFALIYFLTEFYRFPHNDSLGLDCIALLVAILSIFFQSFSQIGTIIYTEKSIRGGSPTLKEIWSEYKANLGHLIMLSLVGFIPGVVILLCSLVLLVIIIVNLDIVIRGVVDVVNVINLTFWISAPFIECIWIFSCLGLLFNKLGIMKSIKHGVSVLSSNISKVLTLGVILGIPFFISYSVLWIVLRSQGSTLSLDMFQVAAKYPLRIWFNAVDSLSMIFSTFIYVIAYHVFIKDVDFSAAEPKFANP